MFTFLRRANCEDPATVLKVFVRKFVRGRPLDIEDEDDSCEGKTMEIFIERYNIFDEAMSELVTNPPLYDVSYTLEVTFTGESAADYGGPRKEFLGCAFRMVRDKLFRETGNQEYELFDDIKAFNQNHYYGAGLIFGK